MKLLMLTSAVLPDFEATAPPGFEALAAQILGFGLWAVGILGGGMFIYAAGKIIIGMNNRKAMATEGLTHLPFIVGGFGLALAAPALVALFFI